jgi:Fe-S cluster biogenesis protein NfuA
MSREDKIKEALESVRPFLKADGGDLEIVSMENKVLKIKLIGSCSTCAMSEMTLKAGIEEAVKSAVPEIEEVVAV